MRKIISLAVTAILITCISGIIAAGAEEQKSLTANPGWYNIMYFGAVPNDGVDDMFAFKKAATANAVIYVPEGEYLLEDTLYLENCTLIGAGSDKTTIVADIEDPAKPAIQAGRTTSMSGFTVKYKDGLVTGQEKQGERIGIYPATSLALQRGSKLSDIVICNVGTGIVSGINTLQNVEDVIFSVTFDKVTIRDFSFRGLDFNSDVRTGNYFKDITVSSGIYHANSAVYFAGEESETVFDIFTVKDTIAEIPVYFQRMNALSAKKFIFDNVYATKGPILSWESSSGVIDYMFFDYCDTADAKYPAIGVGSSKYIYNDVCTLNSLKINTLKLNSMNSTNVNQIATRTEDEVSDFYFSVEEYIVKNSDMFWDEFPADDNKIHIMKKGNIESNGTTDDRPTTRLCPYYSEYKDTTLGKTVLWTGKEWK